MPFMVLSQRHTDRFSESDFDEVIQAETERVRTLHADNVVRQIWLRVDRPGGCFLIEAAALAAAQAVVQSLPMAGGGPLGAHGHPTVALPRVGPLDVKG